MPTSTPNLSLYKYNTNTDGNMTFNITNSLNNNWDKIDTYCKNLSDNKAEKSAVNSALALKADTSAVNSALALKADLADLDTKANITQLHALKGYEDAGELLTDAEGLADVIKYAHSSFDLSKFTVVGSPNITDDGIASGFVSQTNYITCSFTSVSATNKVELWGAITNNSADTAGSVICATNGNLRITKQSVNVIGIRGLSGDLTVNSPNLSLQDGDFVIAHAIVTTTDATLQTWVNGVKQTDVTVSGDFSAVATAYDSLYIGGQYNNGNYSPASAIDIKYCKVFIDGVEVFSGNKTGIDTIKPDDYTVEGTPTISADGVASGFSSGNNIQFPFDPTVTDFDIEFEFKKGNEASSTHYLINGALRWYMFSNGGTMALGYGNKGSGDIYQSSALWKLNTNYKLKISRKDNNCNFNLMDIDRNVLIKNYDLDITDATNTINYICIMQVSNISVDLNKVKVYYYGNLVYQPCLKIPYTEGSEQYGGKYVNAQYLPRVKDAYKQGLANDYFTLDEVNCTYTLPMGNLYGMIENKVDKQNLVEVPAVIISTYQNGTSWYNIYSNGFCEQGGKHVSTSTDWEKITLLKIYKDKNYSVIATNSGSSSTAYNIKVSNPTKNDVDGFYVVINNSGTDSWWRTSGYLAEGEY